MNVKTWEKQSADIAEASAEEALKALESDAESGLSAAGVQEKLKQHGYNEISEKKPNPLLRFIGKFWGLTAWMLEAIIILSWILQKYNDMYIVGALLLLNSALGFVQEQRAINAVETLKRKLHVNSKVLRAGNWQIVPARELVPGDIVRVRTGDFVPADLKIIKSEISVDQSSLTGESISVEKKQDDMIYSGSVANRGEATGVVVLTGAKTYFGKTAQLVQIATPKLHIEEVISSVSKRLLAIVAIMLAVALALSVWKGADLLDLLPLMLALLLGAIPVALPAMFTVSMALGSLELIKKGVLVTRLSAPDDAASMDILCVDKTGTITMNKLSVAHVLAFGSYGEEDVILYGALASEEANHDPLDVAFLAEAKRRELKTGKFSVAEFVPFDPKTRRTEAVVKAGGRAFRVMKGGVNAISQECKLDKKTRDRVDAAVAGFAKKGYRTLAVLRSGTVKKPELVGLVALYDPLRPDSKELVDELEKLGVMVKILTGDALVIGKEIGKAAGIGGNVIKVADVKKFFEADEAKAAEIAEKSDGFAEIYPGDKYTIVKALQDRGHIVGMTGDGVNDAPALRQAEVGIAVSNATDVAKGSASVVLTTDGLPSIIGPIKVGRQMFKRINTWILNKISRTVLKTCFIVLAFVITGKFVITASAILLLIFMTDFVKISLSTDNVRISKKPDVWNMDAVSKVAAVLGVVMVVEALGLLWLGFQYFSLADDRVLSTFSFEILFFFAMFSIFVVRERGHFWESMPSRILLAAIILDMAVAVVLSTFGLLGLAALPLSQTLFVIGYSFVFSLLVNDALKTVLLRRMMIAAEG
ncbi:TPA: plasma-membrane proton-efflux P-type ATPase [Candidatus Micrarchaeota archaeon]|nr:plasma-membrane proton-efflux P-type ATPase [Candidatus Micrarchaeota archaeon]